MKDSPDQVDGVDKSNPSSRPERSRTWSDVIADDDELAQRERPRILQMEPGEKAVFASGDYKPSKGERHVEDWSTADKLSRENVVFAVDQPIRNAAKHGLLGASGGESNQGVSEARFRETDHTRRMGERVTDWFITKEFPGAERLFPPDEERHDDPLDESKEPDDLRQGWVSHPDARRAGSRSFDLVYRVPGGGPDDQDLYLAVESKGGRASEQAANPVTGLAKQGSENYYDRTVSAMCGATDEVTKSVGERLASAEKGVDVAYLRVSVPFDTGRAPDVGQTAERNYRNWPLTRIEVERYL